MRFEPTIVGGVHVIAAEEAVDERGAFRRLYCRDEFLAAGISFTPLQTSLSTNPRRFTLRGMHYTTEPEAKIVRCTRGRILDVAVDVRRHSATFLRWCGFELTAANGLGLFLPAGVAHGFLSLEDETDVLYQMDRIHRVGFDKGIRWNDPAVGIEWPTVPAVINQRDASYPDFSF